MHPSLPCKSNLGSCCCQLLPGFLWPVRVGLARLRPVNPAFVVCDCCQRQPRAARCRGIVLLRHFQLLHRISHKPHAVRRCSGVALPEPRMTSASAHAVGPAPLTSFERPSSSSEVSWQPSPQHARPSAVTGPCMHSALAAINQSRQVCRKGTQPEEPAGPALCTARASDIRRAGLTHTHTHTHSNLWDTVTCCRPGGVCSFTATVGLSPAAALEEFPTHSSL